MSLVVSLVYEWSIGALRLRTPTDHESHWGNQAAWLTKLDGGLSRLNEADDDAVNWLKYTAAASALAKYINSLSTITAPPLIGFGPLA